MKIPQLIKEDKAKIVDVRSRGEFSGGHVAGSINIPLNELPDHVDELKELDKPLVLCCASGMRSAQAQHYLSREGLDCHNAGSWLEVNFLVAQTA
ncbi:MAG: rhodanese-like domain-containing protein [Salinimicrobium sp.]